MSDKFDEVIENAYKNRPKVPREFVNKMVDSIHKIDVNKNIKLNNIRKAAIGICACAVLTSGVVFGNSIINKFFNLKEMGMSTNSIDNAVNNGYIQNIDMNYIKAEDMELKFVDFLMDDINMIVTMEAKLQYDVSEFTGISISDLYIMDNNGNQIYIESEDEKIHSKSFAKTVRWNMIQEGENKILITLLLTGDNLPECDELYFSFGRIVLYSVSNGVPNVKNINGEYNVKLQVSDVFKNRNTKQYKVKKVENKKYYTSIEKVAISETGVEVIVNIPKDKNFSIDLYNNDSKINLYKNGSAVIDISEDVVKYLVWYDINPSEINLNDIKINVDVKELGIDIKNPNDNTEILYTEEYIAQVE